MVRGGVKSPLKNIALHGGKVRSLLNLLYVSFFRSLLQARKFSSIGPGRHLDSVDKWLVVQKLTSYNKKIDLDYYLRERERGQWAV